MTFSQTTNHILTVIMDLDFAYICGCARLIHGGDRQIFRDWFKTQEAAGKEVSGLPYCHIIGGLVATIAFAALCALHRFDAPFMGIACAIFAAAWYLTFTPPHQPYYDIGSSSQPARAGVGFIDWILLQIWKQGPDAKPMTLYSVSRDATGEFLRMMFALPGFFLIAYLIHRDWRYIFPALGYSATFAALCSLAYGLYNWYWPKSLDTDDALDPAELFIGMSYAAMLVLSIA